MATVAARLEAVVQRLEKLADSLAAGGGAVPAVPGVPAAPTDKPKFVEDYQEFLETEVAAFLAAAKAIPGCVELEIDSMASILYSSIGKVMNMAADCKKPEQKALMEILAPVTSLFPKAEKAAFKKGDCRNHATAFKEMLSMINFLFVPKPRGFAEEAYTQPDMYLNKIRTLAKKKLSGDAKTQADAFCDTAKAVGISLKDYIKKYHAAGVTWNMSGIDVKEWTPGASAGGGPPPPPAPPAGMLPPPPVIEAAPAVSTASSGGGMSAVFAQINKGSKQCESAAAGGATAAFKLKRVTKEMKKAMKKLPPKKVSEKKKTVKKKTVAKKVVKPPSLEYRQGTWRVYNQVDNVEVKGVEVKHNVYIYNAQKNVITVPGKVKSITMDGCKRATVIFDSVISVFELVGCDACKVFCREAVPSVTIDKSKGTQLNLSAEPAKNPPDIVTSNISETNVILPGTNPDKDDPIEIALPEQYITKISGTNGKWDTDTTMVTHGG
mmetsp:Transcript_13980/g.21147  ORF Transcript_13980/g.21147 Transcript_13980/m.21147 type:complete len:494 (+) Transcript_13980:24-1505(+)